MRGWSLGVCFVLSLGAEEPSVQLTRVASGLFRPTDIQHAGDESGRLFIVQQDGRILILKNGILLATPFLDIRNRTTASGERGLLGLAFPPGFSQKQYFYVNYTNLAGNSVIARYLASGNPDVAGASSESILLTIPQPFSNHNGGQIRFGPDGYLYVGMGDGGSAGDPQNNAQNPAAVLGKMLRLDVEPNLSQPRVPPDNPFVNNPPFDPRIWALGLRNPWRFSFDRATGDLWIADVGQNRAEEVNFQPASSRGGENYGWNRMEGLQCFQPGCSTTGLTLPVVEYTRNDGCSVTGGFVYRGSGSGGLRGTYVFGDFCSGRIWGLRREGQNWVRRLLAASGLAISAFGEDEAGELYVADHAGGAVYRISGASAPAFTPASVVNAASYASGIAAGSAAAIFVSGVRDAPGISQAAQTPLPPSLDGVSVTVNGHTAPLFAVAHVNGVEQVNVQVPFEVEGAAQASVVVTRNGISSSPVNVPLFGVQPGVFTIDGTNAIAVHNAGNTLVTVQNPLVAGEFAYFYATGLGPVDRSPGTGNPGPGGPLASTRLRVDVTIGGAVCQVLFAGLAPALVGVYQVSFRVPAGLASGLHELVAAVGGTASPPTRVPVR